MPLPVTLLSGRTLEAAVCPGRFAAELKRDLARQLSAEPAQLHIVSGTKELDDDAPIPADCHLHAIVRPRLSWLDDGSGCIKDEGEGVVSISGTPDPVHGTWALCSNGISHGEQYFEVEVLAGGRIGVGVTTQSGFEAGSGLHSLLLSGNGSVAACNGSAPARPFGDAVKRGHVIGVLLEVSHFEVRVTLWQNGRCLGLAFEAELGSEDTTLYPVVRSFASNDRCRIRYAKCPYASRARERKATRADAHPAEGLWTLRSLLQGPGLEEDVPTDLESGAGVRLRVRGALAGFRLGFPFKQVSTTIAQLVQPFCLDLKAVSCTSLMAICRHSLWSSASGQGTLWVAEGNSTLMDGRQEDVLLEQRCLGALCEVDAWHVEGSGEEGEDALVMTGPTVRMVWRPFDEPVPQPCKGSVLY